MDVDRYDLSMASLMKKVCGLQGEGYYKINLIWSHSILVFWSSDELFSKPSYTGEGWLKSVLAEKFK